ncbi:MAG: hypothetical protein BRD39_02295 [Bacteroidetes bacterium QH_9_64_21]|nr:MAG: hypothetical protein BRD39_02295 [Bacteroidetes bacterium QH_9_64_21]
MPVPITCWAQRENERKGRYRAVQKYLKTKPLGMGVWEYVGVEKIAYTPTLPCSTPFRQSILDRGRRTSFTKFLTHR